MGRNNKDLAKYIIPYAFYDSGYKYLRDTYFYPPLPYKVLDKTPSIINRNNALPSTTVLVVGETARADKFASNGYSRNTTPFMNDIGAVSFNDVTSCGTATAVSVPVCFLDFQGKAMMFALRKVRIMCLISYIGLALT